MSDDRHIETVAVHAGRVPTPAGDVTPPIHPSSAYEHDGPYLYAKLGSPTRETLERCLATLEGGESAAAFSSGTAATAAVLRAVEGHVVASADLFHGTRTLLTEHVGADVSFVDTSDLAATEAATRPDTALVLCETPSNPMLRITDIAAVTALAHAREALCVVDNTWAPTLQRPFESGADLVVYSTTKYVSGHGDLIGGAVIARQAEGAFERIRRIQGGEGAVPSAFDCWLTLRGIRTLPYRMRIHSHNAHRVAEQIAGHRAVTEVLYPGLPSHPGHDVARGQMVSPGGMLSFRLRAGAEAAQEVARRTELFVHATSLGATESLIEHRASTEGPDSTTPDDLVRLSVGLEHPDDLVADLENALS